MWKLSSNLLRRSSKTLIRHSSSDLKAVLAEKIPEEQDKIKAFRKSHGNVKVSDVTINSIYGGLRGVTGLSCETSQVDPELGIKFRGYTIPECQRLLPKAENGEQPLPEALFWLLATGDIPNDEQARSLSSEWALRAELPVHVCKFLKTCPKHVHPMTQFSAACTLLNTESEFVKAYSSRVSKAQHWEYVYEDAMNLIAKTTPIAALIYRNTFKDNHDIGYVDTSRCYSTNFCKMLGFDSEEFVELMRMYLTIHGDHEGGNVCAHATHLVGSALSDPYLAFGAGLNGLAGPLHGLANQEVLRWLQQLQKEVAEAPTEEQIKEHVQKRLKSGRVIPGYGHAVLRKTDPRFLCQMDFALKHMPDDPLFKIVQSVFNVVPPLLQALGKVQNPWPNVDAHSGVLLQHYGLTETNFYTVLFGVSRCLGVMASLIWHRALGLPIERPKSAPTDLLMQIAGQAADKVNKKRVNQ